MSAGALVIMLMVVGAGVFLVVAWRRWRRRLIAAAVVAAALGVLVLVAVVRKSLPAGPDIAASPPVATAQASEEAAASSSGWVVPVLLACLGLVAVGVVVRWYRRSRSSSVVARWGSRSRRTSGVATSVEIARVAGTVAVRRRAPAVRPSMRGQTRRERWQTPTTDVATLLCKVGPLRVWSSVEDVTLVFGGPRTGKTGWLAGRVVDAPGALLVTSTRTDLHDLTASLRSRRGPVYVFNAVGLGGLDSTVTFDPLTGCTDPVSAAERAADLLAAGSHGGGGDREFWDAQARRVLAALLHAAALGGLQMRDVLRWVADPDAAQKELTSLLRRSSEPAYVQDATQFVTTNDRTRTSITSTIMPSLGWLTSPAAAAAASGGHPLDVADLLDSRATVFLLGGEETQAAPLLCALTGHIAREARRIAARRPAGRLDPPLTLALDEAALISPVPLESWTADMGGRGVTILAAFQSRAQVIARWGGTGAAIIINNAASIMVFGGTRDRDDLGYWSTLAGDRDEPVTTTNDHGKVTSRSMRQVPVVAPAQLGNLPAGQVLVFRRGMSPVVGSVVMAWDRRDVRVQAKLDRQAAERAALNRRWTEVWTGTWSQPVDMPPPVPLYAVPEPPVVSDVG